MSYQILLITGFVLRVRHVEQDLLTLPNHLQFFVGFVLLNFCCALLKTTCFSIYVSRFRELCCYFLIRARLWYDFCMFVTFLLCLICQYSRVTHDKSNGFLFYIICFHVRLLFNLTWYCLIFPSCHFCFLYVCTSKDKNSANLFISF